MSKKKKKSKTKEEAPRLRVPFTTLIGRFVLTALAVLVILYIAALVIPRTDGFRFALEEKATEKWGLPITIEGSSMTPGLLLKLSGIALAGEGEEDGAGFSAEHAHVTWCPTPGKGRSRVRRVTLINPSLSFAQTPSGGWQPEEFSEIGGWMDKWIGMDLKSLRGGDGHAGSHQVDKQEAAAEDKGPGPAWNIAVEVKGGRVAWRDAAGQMAASANAVDAEITPVGIPGHEGRHIKLAMGSAQIPDGKIMRDVTFEMMSIDANQVLLGFNADWSAGIKKSEPKPEPALSQEAPVVVEADVDDIAAAIRKALQEAMDE